MKESQLLKGVLEGLCAGDYFQKKAIYGYELIQSLKEMGFDKIVGWDHLSPLKIRKTRNYSWEMRPSPDGPDRKYFSPVMLERAFRGILGPVAGASHKSRTYQEGGGRMVESYTEKCQMN